VCGVLVRSKQEPKIDNSRIRRSIGDSTDYCFRDFNRGSWQETCGGKICSVAPVTREKEFRAEVDQELLETANKDPDFPKRS
jgi:hypothetical protein